MNNNFVIGIGSQRAGSTLLHSLLSASTNIFMHPVKELHYFDTYFGYRSQRALKDFSLNQVLRIVDEITQFQRFNINDKMAISFLRTNRILATKDIKDVNYLDLFRPFLSTHHLLGEVTPEYMLLNPLEVKKMKDVIGDARVILICRNPLDRMISAIKLMNSYHKLNMNDLTANLWLEDQLKNETGWIKVQDDYNDYKKAIESFSSQFEKFIAIDYEYLIKKPRIVAKLIDDKTQLDIDYEIFEESAKKIKNDLGESFKISDKNISLLNKRYSKYIDFYNLYFGN